MKSSVVGGNHEKQHRNVCRFADLNCSARGPGCRGCDQEKQSHPNKTHHYQIVDLGSTFGGPQSYIIPGSGDAFAGSSVLNNGGTVAGFADTAVNDPFPDLCFWDCNIVHAFLAQSGRVLTDLGRASWWREQCARLDQWKRAELQYFLRMAKPTPFIRASHNSARFSGNGAPSLTWAHCQKAGYQSEAGAVNSSGQVVGTAMSTVPDVNSMQAGIFLLWGGDGGIMPPYQYQTRAFLWDKQKGMQDLGTLSGGRVAAFLINERGQVVGLSYTSSTQIGGLRSLSHEFIHLGKRKRHDGSWRLRGDLHRCCCPQQQRSSRRRILSELEIRLRLPFCGRTVQFTNWVDR